MKQLIITVAMLAIALALVIGVVVPIMEHGADTGNNSVSEARSVLPQVGQLLK